MAATDHTPTAPREADETTAGKSEMPTDLGPIGLVDGHTRESQIAAARMGFGDVPHPDQQAGTARLQVEISEDGLQYRVNDSSWYPTFATTLHRRSSRPEFDPKKLAKQMRLAGFPFPRGKAVAGGSHTFERRLPFDLMGRKGDTVPWIPGKFDAEEGEVPVVWLFKEWTGEAVSAWPTEVAP